MEGIFLIVFVLLNLFLFSIYQEGLDDKDMAIRGGISETLESRLKADNIKFPSDLSSEVETGYYLSAEEMDLIGLAQSELKNQEWRISDNLLISEMMNGHEVPINLDIEEKQLHQFMSKKGNVINGQKYIRNRPESKPLKKYVFNQVWENIPFCDDTSKISVIVEEDEEGSGKITGYQQSMLENIEPLREQQNLITARDAIISLYTNNRLQSGYVIDSIELGYTRIFTIRGKNVYIPAWFVSISVGGKPSHTERVNGFTSTVISTGVSEVTD